jgi:hypothetical protein
MKFLATLDKWIEGSITTVLVWLEEWLSISQKYVERFLILLYLGLLLTPWSPHLLAIGIELFAALIMGTIMWHLHRKPKAWRGLMRLRPGARQLRAVFAIICVLYSAVEIVLPRQRTVDSVESGLLQIIYIVFIYCTDIANQGERGRKRKLAWDEIKKLFGTEWVPKPIEVQ